MAQMPGHLRGSRAQARSCDRPWPASLFLLAGPGPGVEAQARAAVLLYAVLRAHDAVRTDRAPVAARGLVWASARATLVRFPALASALQERHVYSVCQLALPGFCVALVLGEKKYQKNIKDLDLYVYLHVYRHSSACTTGYVQ